METVGALEPFRLLFLYMKVAITTYTVKGDMVTIWALINQGFVSTDKQTEEYTHVYNCIYIYMYVCMYVM